MNFHPWISGQNQGGGEFTLQYVRQLSALLQGNVDLLRALEILIRQFEGQGVDAVVQGIATGVSQGRPLDEVLGDYPRVFSPDIVALAASGQQNGQLAYFLTLGAASLERRSRLQQRVQGALIYPVLVIGVTALLSYLLMFFVFPAFFEMLQSSGRPLPQITLVFIAVVRLFTSPWSACLGLGLLCLLYPGARHWWSQPAHRLKLNNWLWKVPMIGPLLQTSAFVSYTSAFLNLIDSGVRLSDTARLAAATSGSQALIVDAGRIEGDLQLGIPLSVAFHSGPAGIYPASLLQMVRVGEESSCLDRAFQSLERWFQLELEVRLQTFLAMLEPILMAFVASLVGFFVLSVFTPLYASLENLGV